MAKGKEKAYLTKSEKEQVLQSAHQKHVTKRGTEKNVGEPQNVFKQTREDQLDQYTELILENIKDRLPRLEKLLNEMNNIWCYEDGIYRFYHQSFKVYPLQHLTVEATHLFEEIGKAAEIKGFNLSPYYRTIVSEGTGIIFEVEHNDAWVRVTRPIVEAFLHARYFIEMHVKYGRALAKPPQPMPSGWAAILCLYHIR
jgi:hypothetical protein